MKRLTSLDFWRGIAIFFTALFHFLFVSWDKFQNPGDVLSSGIGLLITGVVIFVLIHWRGFFLMISAVVNFYQMENAAKKGRNIWGIFGKQILSGFILILLGKLWMFAFPYWGFIESWTRDPNSTLWGGVDTLAESFSNNWGMVFMIEAIESIGLMMIITVFFFLLFQLKVFREPKSSWLVKVIICYAIGFGVIIISPYVHTWITNALGGYDLSQGENFRIFGGYRIDSDHVIPPIGAIFGRIALNWLVGREAPLFPMLGSYFIGAGITYVIVQEKPKRSHLRWMLIPSLLALLGGAFDLYREIGFDFANFMPYLSANIGFHVHPRWFALVSLGLQAPLILATLSWVEFNPKINEKRWLAGTRFIRRFGVFALTVYFLGIMDFVVRLVLAQFIPIGDGTNFTMRYGLNDMWTWITAGIIMVLWTFGLYIWDKVGRGYGSFEFYLSLIKIPQAGRKRDWKDPVNLRGSLWDVEMISFVR